MLWNLNQLNDEGVFAEMAGPERYRMGLILGDVLREFQVQPTGTMADD